MRVKKVKIGIKSFEDFLEGAKDAMKRLEGGEKVKKQRGIYFENLKAFRRALTEKRLEMLHVIKEKRPKSIYELAKLLNRNTKNVSQDIAYLREIGLVELKRTEEKRERIIPFVGYELIDLQIAV
ncbi:MAG: ArsR family transcriptional regulator [Nitrospirota bacterium]|mgnify:CR=1 FL=1